MNKQTICVSMIVKDELHVIQRCLDSLKPYVACFCIVDTGSTDGTSNFVEQYLNGTPRLIFRRPWVNFGHNRQEALELARPLADYILFFDADDVLKAPSGFEWPALTLPGYNLPIIYGDTHYQRCVLVNSKAPWRWEAPVHEYLTSDIHLEQGTFDQPEIHIMHDGARSKDPTTYLKDIALLEAAEPTPRNVFYLAQSYKDAEMKAQALATYERRMQMAGWAEETWYAELEAAKLTEQLKPDPNHVQLAFLTCFQHRPTRAEPLFYLAKYHRLRGEYATAFMYAKHALEIPLPSDRLFVDASIYRWRIADEFSTAAYYVGELKRGREVLEKLLVDGHAPTVEIPRLLKNLEFYQNAASV